MTPHTPHCISQSRTKRRIASKWDLHDELFAGLLSSWGFVYLSDILEEKIGLRDTCGVHNLHGMPGLLGGLVPIVALTSCCEHSAAHAQVLAVICTLIIAIFGGTVSAWLVSFIPTETGAALEKAAFEDASAFEVEEED